VGTHLDSKRGKKKKKKKKVGGQCLKKGKKKGGRKKKKESERRFRVSTFFDVKKGFKPELYKKKGKLGEGGRAGV